LNARPPPVAAQIIMWRKAAIRFEAGASDYISKPVNTE
jgi:CheY-like chemotaxis protein